MDGAPEDRARPRRIAVLAVTGVLVVVTLVAAGLVLRLQSSLTTVPIHDDEQLIGATARDEPVTILVLGSDNVDDGSRRSDVLIVVHLARADTRIDAVQIPRDTVVDRPACDDTGEGVFAGGRGMINAALNHGLACSVAAVETLTGLHMDHAVEIDFDGFVAVIDALGGLPVRLVEPLRDPQADLDLPSGEQVLTGSQALALARTRHAVGDGSDLARLDNQKMVISALVTQIAHQDLARRPDRLHRLAMVIVDATTVDDGLGSAPALAALGRRFAAVPTTEVTVVTMPWELAPDDPNRVVPGPDADALFARVGQDQPLA